MIPVLGADPGQQAGASLVDFGPVKPSVLCWWSWCWLKAKGGRFRLTHAHHKSDRVFSHDVDSMHDVGERISVDIHLLTGSTRVATVALEGLYIAAVKGATTKARAMAAKKAQSMIPCAEMAGEIQGPLRALGPIQRPTANEWLGSLGLTSSLGSARLEAYCLQIAKRRYEWPGGFPKCPTQKELVAVVESAHMAAHVHAIRRTTVAS